MLRPDSSRTRGVRSLNRRRLLWLGAAAPAIAAACSSSKSNSNSAASPPLSTLATTTAASRASLASATAVATRAQATAAPATKKGGSLTQGGQLDLIWANAPYNFTGPSLPIQFAVYDTLFRYEKADLTPTPRLAQSFAFNDDQTMLTVTLKPNIAFHDGKPITAQAVVDSFTSLSDKNTPSSQLATVGPAYVDKATAVDEHTVSFALKRPGNLVFDLFNIWAIADATNIDAIKKGGLPNGSGPFKVTSATPKQGGRLDAFKGFWKPAQLDGIDYKVFPDRASLAVALQSGAIDYTPELSPDDVVRFSKMSGYTLTVDKGLTGATSFGMNVKDDVMKDPRVRRALYMLLDRKRVVSDVQLGQGQSLYSLWPPSSPAFEQRYATDPFNVSAAKQLISDAGYPNGTPPIPVLVASTDANNKSALQLFQEDAKKAGVNLQLNSVEFATYASSLLNGSYQGCYMGSFGFYSYHPETLFVTNVQVRVPNSANFTSPDYDQVLQNLVAATNDQQRTAAYQAFNKLWDANMWVFLITNNNVQWITSKKVAGLRLTDFGVPVLEEIGQA